MTKVISTIDLSAVLDKLTGPAVDRALDLSTEHLLSEANKHVPHDDGTLERSGRASRAGKRGAVSYDTPYAVVQHERMDLHHDGKGEAKWLETTLSTESDAVGQIVAAALREGLES